MKVRNSGLARKWTRPLAALFAMVVPAVASAGESPSDDYYFGGFAGVGVARSVERGIFPDPGIGYTAADILVAPPISAQAGGAGASLSLIFGKNHPVFDGFSVGFEFEGGYRGGRGSSSGSFESATIPLLEFEESNSVVSSTQWSVPAQAALRARASFQVSPSVSVYGALGPTLGYARFRATFTEIQRAYGYEYEPPLYQYYNATTLNVASPGKSLVDPGISLGAGIEVALAHNIGLRGEYSLAAFQSIVERDPWGYAIARATPMFQDVRLGIVRHF